MEQIINDETNNINVYVGEDGKLHFVDKEGADTVLNFSSSYESGDVRPFYTTTAFNSSKNWCGTGYTLPSEGVKSIAFKSHGLGTTVSAFIGVCKDNMLGSNGVNFSYPAGYDQGNFGVLFQESNADDNHEYFLDNISTSYERIVFGVGWFTTVYVTYKSIYDVKISFY